MKQAPARQQKIAAQRAAEHRRQVRNRVLMSSGAIVVVIAIVVAFVVLKAGAGSKGSATGASNGPTGTTLSKVVSNVTNVPASTLNKVGIGSVTSTPQKVSGPPLTSGGKPEMLYIGAEYCPYCAAERWAMIIALSRFGTFSGLHTVHSSSKDTPANVPTFTFYGSHYTSKYLTFTPVEETTNVPDSSSPAGYKLLQTPTKQQQALLSKYDQGGSIPFIDVGNKYVQVGDPQGLDATTLTGKSWTQIAQALQDPSSPIAKEIDGAANQLTAAIAKVTGHQPSRASAQVIQSIEAKL